MTKPKEELLEEAKLRYPINTKFKVVHHPEVERTVYSHNSVKNNFVHASDGLHINLLIDTTDTASVYFNGKWAEITHYVIPEKWCVKVNSSHLDYPELYQWRLESPVSCNWGNHEGYIHSTGIHYLDIKTGYTEIRIEDFIKYIYKGNTETTKTKEPSKYCEYWKYIEDNLSGFTKDKIYKTLYPENVNKCSSFINNYGKEDGWLGKNTEKFIPSTYEEYCKQEGINVVPKYVKVICSWHNDWTTDKIYKVEDTQRTFPDRLYVRCDKKRLVDVCNWEKNFKICTEEEYLAQNPKKEEPMEDYTGKYIKAKIDSPQCTGVKKGETIKIVKALDTHVYMLDVTKSGVSCMDIYRPLDLSHWELVEGPSLVGRYVRFIKQIDPRLPIGCYDLIVGEESNYISLEKYLACNKSRVGRDLEIMPEGFTPEQSTAETILDKWLRETKELNLSLKELTSRIAVCDYSEVYIKLEGSHSDSKAKILYDMWNTTSTIEQAIPEYVECINDVACSGELSKGKIYKVIEHDGFEKTYKLKDLVCPRDVSRFKPSTKESYDRQEYVVVQYGSVDITFGDSYTAGLGDPKAYTGKIPKLHMADEAGQWVTDRFIGKTWVSERGISTFWPIKFDTYKPEKKQIKIIELPKVKKRFVY